MADNPVDWVKAHPKAAAAVVGVAGLGAFGYWLLTRNQSSSATSGLTPQQYVLSPTTSTGASLVTGGAGGTSSIGSTNPLAGTYPGAPFQPSPSLAPTQSPATTSISGAQLIAAQQAVLSTGTKISTFDSGSSGTSPVTEYSYSGTTPSLQAQNSVNNLEYLQAAASGFGTQAGSPALGTYENGPGSAIWSPAGWLFPSNPNYQSVVNEYA